VIVGLARRGSRSRVVSRFGRGTHLQEDIVMSTWIFYAQIGMALFGVLLICAGTIEFGKRKIDKPLPALAGVFLLLPLPVCVGMTLLFGTSDVFGGMRTSRAGDNTSQARDAAENARLIAAITASGNVAQDAAVTGLGLVSALGLMLAGLWRNPKEEESPLAVDPVPAPVFGSQGNVSLETLNHRPALPAKVKRYRGAANFIPPAVEAMGKAKHVHAPLKSFGRSIRQRPKAIAFLGLLMLGLAAAALYLFSSEPAALAGGIAAAAVGITLLALSRCPAPPIPTYVVYRDALLIVLGNDFTIIPWKVVTNFHLDHGITTSDDHHFVLSTQVQGWRHLVQKVQEHIAAEQLPVAQEMVAAGLTAIFGPFGVTNTALTCESKTVPWEQLTKVIVQPDAHGGTLEIRAQDRVWCRSKLDFPNEFIFVEMLKRLCQPHAVVTGA
jgi:hypothetical protein